jgi:hypothetical protein
MLRLGDYLRHWPCNDCFEPLGFPIIYRAGGGFASDASLHPLGVIADVAATLFFAWMISSLLKRMTGNK